MSKNCVKATFNIPLSIPPTKVTQKYRSPDPSPITVTNSEFPLQPKDFSAKSNLSQNYSNSINWCSKISESVSSSKENISDMQSFIQKFHPALAQKPQEYSKNQGEDLIRINKRLKVAVLEKEAEILQAVTKVSNEVSKNIQKTQNEIDALEDQLMAVKNNEKVAEAQDVLRILKENEQTAEDIETIQELVEDYKAKGIRQEEYLTLQKKISGLENTYESLISKNLQLKRELDLQISVNNASKAKAEGDRNIRSLADIHELICKLQKVGKKFMANENITLNDLIVEGTTQKEINIANLVQTVRKEMSNLRMLVSDIYAENCGYACQNQ